MTQNEKNQDTQSDECCPIFALIETRTSDLSDGDLELQTTKFRTMLETPQTLKKVLGGVKGKTRKKATKKKAIDISALDF